MHTNYVHIATLTVAELVAYAVTLGVRPSELLDGRFWIRRVPSIHEGKAPVSPLQQRRSASASAGD